jgi:hypothetical protein
MAQIRIMLFGLFLTLSSAASAQVLMQGAIDCGRWINARTTNQSVAFEHYILGHINGMSLGSEVSIWGQQNISVSKEQTYLWFDKYCRDNPLRQVVEGSIKFADEMTNGLYSKTIQSRPQ